MGSETGTYTRVGAWGQILACVLGVGCWLVGATGALYAVVAGYLLVTIVGIVDIIRTEEIPVHGPIIYPFMIPGFVPLYYFAMKL